LARQGKMDEWNETVSRLYQMADDLGIIADTEMFPEWTREKANTLKNITFLLPSVSA
jgi:hypothetical protein